MWLDWLVFCEYGFSVFAFWCPLATLTVLLGFLLPWAWGISSRLLQQSAAIAPYLGRGVSPHLRPSWPSTWDSSSRPSCARTATAPWTWGWSSQPPVTYYCCFIYINNSPKTCSACFHIAYFPPVYLVWCDIYSDLFPIFNWVVYLYCWVLRILCVFEITSHLSDMCITETLS